MYDLEKIEYQNKRVLLTSQLAEGYGTDTNNIKNNFNNHKDRFIEGKHYYLLQGEELRSFKREVNNIDLVPNNVNKLYLWSKKGTLRHTKILDTDKAWEIFEILEDSYFAKQDNHYKYNPHLEMANQILHTLMRQEREQNRLATEITSTKKEITKTQDDLQEIRDTIQINPKNWRSISNKVIHKISLKNAEYKDKAKIYRELYAALDQRLGVHVGKRLNNKKNRMAIEGMSKSKIESTNILDVISEDKKLIVGYITILKEFAIKNGVGVVENN